MKLFKKKSPVRTTSVGTENDGVRVAWVEKQLLALDAGWRILDAGAGEQRFRPYCTHLKYVSQDFGKYIPEQEERGLQMPEWEYGDLDHECDIVAIPELDNSFDAILCSEVFEHIPNPLPALDEFSRLLKPGGRLLLSAPFLSLTHFAPYHFCSGFNRFFYETHLPEAGFQIDEITCNGNFFELVAQELRRVPSVADRYASSTMTPSEQRAAQEVLEMLERFSQRNSGSEELACFGLQVVATRLEKSTATN